MSRFLLPSNLRKKDLKHPSSLSVCAAKEAKGAKTTSSLIACCHNQKQTEKKGGSLLLNSVVRLQSGLFDPFSPSLFLPSYPPGKAWAFSGSSPPHFSSFSLSKRRHTCPTTISPKPSSPLFPPPLPEMGKMLQRRRRRRPEPSTHRETGRTRFGGTIARLRQLCRSCLKV